MFAIYQPNPLDRDETANARNRTWERAGDQLFATIEEAEAAIAEIFTLDYYRDVEMLGIGRDEDRYLSTILTREDVNIT